MSRHKKKRKTTTRCRNMVPTPLIGRSSKSPRSLMGSSWRPGFSPNPFGPCPIQLYCGSCNTSRIPIPQYPLSFIHHSTNHHWHMRTGIERWRSLGIPLVPTKLRPNYRWHSGHRREMIPTVNAEQSFMSLEIQTRCRMYYLGIFYNVTRSKRWSYRLMRSSTGGEMTAAYHPMNDRPNK